MHTIKTFTKILVVNGHALDAEISIAWDYDHDVAPEGDFDFGDADENAAYLARFESGELIMALIRVSAQWEDAEGADYLGACHVAVDTLEQDVLDMADEYSMVETASDELVNEIQSKIKTYSALA